MCLFIYPCRAISAYAYKEIVFSSFQMEEICFTNTTVNSCSRNTRPHISLLGKESLPIQPWMWLGHCRQKPLTLGSSLPSAAHCAQYVTLPPSGFPLVENTSTMWRILHIYKIRGELWRFSCLFEDLWRFS